MILTLYLAQRLVDGAWQGVSDPSADLKGTEALAKMVANSRGAKTRVVGFKLPCYLMSEYEPSGERTSHGYSATFTLHSEVALIGPVADIMGVVSKWAPAEPGLPPGTPVRQCENTALWIACSEEECQAHIAIPTQSTISS